MERGKRERGAEREIKRGRCTLTDPLYCSLFQKRCATRMPSSVAVWMCFYFTKVENVVRFLEGFQSSIGSHMGMTVCWSFFVAQDLTVTMLALTNPSHSVIGSLHYILWTQGLTDLDVCLSQVREGSVSEVASPLCIHLSRLRGEILPTKQRKW